MSGMKKLRLGIASLTILILFALGIAACSKVYFVREDPGGTVFWKADEAYLVMSGTRRGYHFRYLEYPWIVFKEYLYAPLFPNDVFLTL
jgi:hypothetical protein